MFVLVLLLFVQVKAYPLALCSILYPHEAAVVPVSLGVAADKALTPSSPYLESFLIYDCCLSFVKYFDVLENRFEAVNSIPIFSTFLEVKLM
jgi:hypothetical protein